MVKDMNFSKPQEELPQDCYRISLTDFAINFAYCIVQKRVIKSVNRALGQGVFMVIDLN